MQHSEFRIGETFWCSGRQWRSTDIGTRTVIAIRIDSVEVGSTNPELRRRLSRDEAEAEGWFKGPPYAAAESVFDEDALAGCSREPDIEEADKWCGLDQTIAEVRSKFTDMPRKELESIIDEAVAAARKTKTPKAG